jgi:Flp pilus assembly protein TadD
MRAFILAALASALCSAAPEPFAQGKQAYARRDFKQAAQAFEQATAAEPTSANAQHWLGKAYGRLAENASFVSAPRYASKCRQAFEKAVELDGKLREAWSDLFSYYLEAPGFLGGGVDKAERAAAKIAALDAAEGHLAQAELAKKRKDFTKAEAELRRAAESSPKDAGRHVDLAAYLNERGNTAASDAAFAQAAALDPNHAGYLFERAKALLKRDPPQARTLLERYIKSNPGPDDTPVAEAQKLLSQVR